MERPATWRGGFFSVFLALHIRGWRREQTNVLPFVVYSRHKKNAQELDKYAGEENYATRLPGAWRGAFAIHQSTNRASARAIGKKKLHKVKGAFEAAPAGKA